MKSACKACIADGILVSSAVTIHKPDHKPAKEETLD